MPRWVRTSLLASMALLAAAVTTWGAAVLAELRSGVQIAISCDIPSCHAVLDVVDGQVRVVGDDGDWHVRMFEQRFDDVTGTMTVERYAAGFDRVKTTYRLMLDGSPELFAHLERTSLDLLVDEYRATTRGLMEGIDVPDLDAFSPPAVGRRAGWTERSIGLKHPRYGRLRPKIVVSRACGIAHRPMRVLAIGLGVAACMTPTLGPMRRMRRRDQGRCERCSYVLAGRPRCPECGADAASRARPRTGVAPALPDAS